MKKSWNNPMYVEDKKVNSLNKILMKKQKILFIVVSAITGDPGKYNIIEKLAYHLTKHNIKSILCLPIEQHVVINNYINKLCNTIIDNHDLIKANSQYFFNVSLLKLKYINLENREKLLKEMNKLHIDSVFFNYINSEIIQDLVEHESNKKQLSLLEFILKNKIIYLGVDDYCLIKNLLDLQGQIQRINAIAENVFSKGVDRLNGANGAIICDIENIYLLKLCMVISKHCENLAKYNKYDIKMSPLFIHSLYVQDELANNQKLFEHFSAADVSYNEYAKEQSKILDYFLVENSDNGEFTNGELGMLMGNIIEYLSETS